MHKTSNLSYCRGMALKKQKKNKKRITRRQFLFYVVFPLLGLLVSIAYLGHQWFYETNAQEGKIIVLYPNPEVPQPNLQLRTFPFITIPPRPTIPQTFTPNTPLSPVSPGTPATVPGLGGNYCPLDDIKPQGSSCTCLDSNAIACPAPPFTGPGIPQCPHGEFAFRLPISDGPWYCIKIGTPGLTDPNPPPPPPGCFASCIAKPIVYLYPEKTMFVDVSVATPGEIFVSDPLYPEGGWKNIEAHPDGTLYYQGKKYSELFYESTVVTDIPMPETGFVVAVNDLYPKLSEVITKLGLKGREHDEFLEFWVPVLKQQKAPYIFFSILPPDVKDSVDRLHITPEPDTRIEIIAYFKALKKPITVEPLALPDTIPARIGFTEVEWGGTIAQ